MKLCKKCNTLKNLEYFSKDKTRSDGLQPYCKECVSLYKKQYSAKNKEKLTQYHAEYRENNKERLSSYHKEYLKNGGREIRKQYRQNNKEKMKLLKSHNEHTRRRAKQKSELNGSDYQVWVNDSLKICTYCNTDCSDNFHVDHVIPLCNNGAHELNNLTIACPACNLSKGSKSLLIFMHSRL